MHSKPCDILGTTIFACRRSFLFTGLISALINLLMLTFSLYMLQVYDRVLTSRSLDTLLYLTLVALAALLTLSLLDMVRSRLLANLSAWLEQRLAPEIIARVLTASLRGSAYRSEALRDLREIRSVLSGPGLLALFDAPWAGVFLGAIFLLHPMLGWLASAGAIGLFALAILNDRLTSGPLKAANAAGVRAMQQIEAANRNAEAIEALGMLRGLLQRWLIPNQQAGDLQMRASHRAGILLGVSKFCRLAVQALMLATGAWLVLHQELTGGGMAAGSIILGRALAPIEQAMSAWKQVIGARAAYQRLKDCLGAPPHRAGSMRLPAPRGDLVAEQVAFVAPDSRRLVLKAISFTLEAGESMAVIGPSAAGKSTLARLAVGICAPAAGHVRLDGAEISHWRREDLGRYIGYLPQDVQLFAGTVAENIARLADPDPGAVVAAARRAAAHEMIVRLPDGYDTEIGEAGGHLSGGQRQRIGLARALFGDPKLVVLDEPNAHLDGEGEVALAQALRALKTAGATVVVITHRPALVALVDRVLLLRDGVVERFGPREETLAYLRPRAIAARPHAEAATSHLHLAE
jgi:PrtD family type I secretion system ABC transporter